MRIKIKLKSKASAYFYTTHKSKEKKPGKLSFRKYDPITRKHELFEEDKIK